VGVNLVGALAERPDFFRRFGGHARAAGFTIARADADALREYLTQRLAAQGTRADAETNASAETSANAEVNAGQPTPLAPDDSLLVDCRLPLDRVNLQKYADIRRLAPFGAAFPEPRFVCGGARIMRCWRSGVEGRNLRLAIRAAGEERVFLWSRQGAICDDLRAALPRLPAFDVVYTFDAYQRADGETQLTARLVALRPADPR
jgi:single-stranded-DNA-specific exonuclease